MRRLFILSLTAVLLLLPLAGGAGGELIRQALNRNVSEFHLFLSKLDGRLHCRDRREAVEGVCTNSIQFHRDTQTVIATINLSPAHPLLIGFSNVASAKKERFLEGVIEEVAIKMGVAPLPHTGGALRIGEIQKVEYEIEGIDMERFKAEFATNVVIEMYVRDGDNVFWTTRGLDGQKGVIKIDRTKLNEKVK